MEDNQTTFFSFGLITEKVKLKPQTTTFKLILQRTDDKQVILQKAQSKHRPEMMIFRFFDKCHKNAIKIAIKIAVKMLKSRI